MPRVLAHIKAATALMGLTADDVRLERQWRLVAFDAAVAPGPGDLPNALPTPIDGPAGLRAVPCGTLEELAQATLRGGLVARLQRMRPCPMDQIASDAPARALLGGLLVDLRLRLAGSMLKAGYTAEQTDRVQLGWCECGVALRPGGLDGLVDAKAGPSLYQQLCHWLWPLAIARRNSDIGFAPPLGERRRPPHGVLDEDGELLAAALDGWGGPPDEIPAAAPATGQDAAQDGLACCARLIGTLEAMRTDARWLVAGEPLWALNAASGPVEQLALASGRLLLGSARRLKWGLPRYRLATFAAAPPPPPPATAPGLRPMAAFEASLDAAADTLASMEVGQDDTSDPHTPVDYAAGAMARVLDACKQVYLLSVKRTTGRLGPKTMRDDAVLTAQLQQDIDQHLARMDEPVAFLAHAARRTSKARPGLELMARLAHRRREVAHTLNTTQVGFTEDSAIRAAFDVRSRWGRVIWISKVSGAPFPSEPVDPGPHDAPGIGEINVDALVASYQLKGQTLTKVPAEDATSLLGVVVLTDQLALIYRDPDAADPVGTLVERDPTMTMTWLERHKQVVDPPQDVGALPDIKLADLKMLKPAAGNSPAVVKPAPSLGGLHPGLGGLHPGLSGLHPGLGGLGASALTPGVAGAQGGLT